MPEVKTYHTHTTMHHVEFTAVEVEMILAEAARKIAGDVSAKLSDTDVVFRVISHPGNSSDRIQANITIKIDHAKEKDGGSQEQHTEDGSHKLNT